MSAQTLLFMDGWMAATPGVPEDYGSVELSSSITSSSVVPEPRLLLLIHLRNKIHYTTPPPLPLHTHSHTHTHTHLPLPLCPTRLGEGGRQDVRPAGHQLRQRNLLNVLLHQKESQISHIAVSSQPQQFCFTFQAVMQPDPVWGINL